MIVECIENRTFRGIGAQRPMDLGTTLANRLPVPAQRGGRVVRFDCEARNQLVPDLATKADVCQNAIDFARTLGVERPKVAILSAVETIRPEDPSTLDAAALCEMAQRGRIRGGVVYGPLSMDTAINPETSLITRIVSEVTGVADILIVPDLESGSLIAQRLRCVTNAQAAQVVLGARVPIVLTSRADCARTRRVNVGLAVLHVHSMRQGRHPSDW